MEGQIIAGKYRLTRVLGKGGMGSVWLADHMSLHTAVAIKLIDAEAAKNPNARTRFEREAQLAARIRSAHVVKVLDHGVTDEGQPYIAMECLYGESLRERLAARGRLTPAETGKIVSHLGRALTRAHEAGLVHRDIKPENIFMSREDDEEIVKILDFGVAKVTDALAATGMDPTRTGALLGTPYYMSPEQAQGLKTVDYRSDLWSLAVVVFECLTGARPFTAPALGPLIGKILGGPIPVPSRAAPDAGISPEIDAWMQSALARDPAQRPASVKVLADSFLLAAGTADTMDRNPPAQIGGAQAVVSMSAPAPAASSAVPPQPGTIQQAQATPGWFGPAAAPPAPSVIVDPGNAMHPHEALEVTRVQSPKVALSSLSESGNWYVSDGERVVGPMALDLLRRGVEAGRVPAGCVVRHASWAEWRPLHEVPGDNASPTGATLDPPSQASTAGPRALGGTVAMVPSQVTPGLPAEPSPPADAPAATVPGPSNAPAPAAPPAKRPSIVVLVLAALVVLLGGAVVALLRR